MSYDSIETTRFPISKAVTCLCHFQIKIDLNKSKLKSQQETHDVKLTVLIYHTYVIENLCMILKTKYEIKFYMTICDCISSI